MRLCRAQQQLTVVSRNPTLRRTMTVAAAASGGSGGRHSASSGHSAQHTAAATAHSKHPAAKTLLLIRHGEGFHNVGRDYNLDAHLTPRGWAQTAALQRHLLSLEHDVGIELVVVSPLRRTLETAAGVFGARAPHAAAVAAAAAAAADSSSSDSDSTHPGWVLMTQQQGRPSEVTQQTALFLPRVSRRAAAGAAAGAGADAAAGDAATMSQGVFVGDAEHHPLKLLAHEGCRERIGPNVCDKFRDTALQAADFPGVDFSLMRRTSDEAFEALHAATQASGCYNTGEAEEACEQRAEAFYAWLMERPESVIAVVSHCGFLVHGMRAIGRGMFSAWDVSMMQRSSSGGGGSAAAASNGSPQTEAGKAASAAAEDLRSAAAEVSGRMAQDWNNCECRAIELRWGSTAELNEAGSVGQQQGRFLVAHPGGTDAWWPGGLHALN